MNEPKEFADIIENGFGLLLSRKERSELWGQLSGSLEEYISRVETQPVIQPSTTADVRRLVKEFDFKSLMRPSELVSWVVENLSRFQLHTTHPAYYGVFNPNPSTMGIVADTIVAAFNPQLASTASSRFCIEIEDHLIRFFGRKFGYPEDKIKGTFTSGGTEANHSALLCALAEKLPNFCASGLKGLERFPVIYTSTETHHSFLRAARLCGLGTDSVVQIPVNESLQIDCEQLVKRIESDLSFQRQPLFLVGTLGTTSAGVVDPLKELGEIALQYGLWYHIDGAWGGAICLLDEYRQLFLGVGDSDSISFDPHKWLSVPMGAGMLVAKHPWVLQKTFQVDASYYMPKETFLNQDTEPYRQSMQWSRRFIGLKLFMTLACHGESGYQSVLRHQIKMGKMLREKLSANNWELVNKTDLPVVCFKDPTEKFDAEKYYSAVTGRAKTWLTTTKLGSEEQKVLRAGISNFATQEQHLDLLVDELNQVRVLG